MFYNLKSIENIISGYNAVITLVYANGKRRITNIRDITEQERNTKVLNIFATGKNSFDIHLTKLYRR